MTGSMLRPLVACAYAYSVCALQSREEFPDKLNGQFEPADRTGTIDNSVSCDMLIVGAGVSGAFAAARYRQFNPTDTICIVERAGVVGGRLQSLPLTSGTPTESYQAELGGMRYFEGVHHLVPAALQQLDLETTQLPYVNAKGMAYLRGNRIRLSDLASQLSSIYNLKSSEAGFSPNVLYNMTITQILRQRDLSIDDLLSNDYMVDHTMFNVLRDGNLSQEGIDAYTDTAGYEWVLASNAAIVTQEDLAIEGWSRMETFVKTGYQSLVKTLLSIAQGTTTNLTTVYLTSSIDTLSWSPSGVTATVVNVDAAPVGDPIPEPAEAPGFSIAAKRAILTVNSLQLAMMADWPWSVEKLMFDVEQVETVKIFLKFSTSWWSDVMPGTGRSVTTLPLRQVWAYAPNVLMIYADSDNARFWKPYLTPYAKSAPTWFDSKDCPDLTHALFDQLGEMFDISATVISAASTEIAFAYWERCTAFWRAGCNITKNIDMSVQPMDGIPVFLATDLWSAQQGWVEGSLNRTEAVLNNLDIPSIMDHPLPKPGLSKD